MGLLTRQYLANQSCSSVRTPNPMRPASAYRSCPLLVDSASHLSLFSVSIGENRRADSVPQQRLSETDTDDLNVSDDLRPTPASGPLNVFHLVTACISGAK